MESGEHTVIGLRLKAFCPLFCVLFWRYGLEAAIIAHGVSHIVSFLMMTLVM